MGNNIALPPIGADIHDLLLWLLIALSLSCYLRRRSNPARHHTDVLAVAPGGNGFYPGDAIAIPKHLHAVDGVDDGGIVAQQNVAEPVGVIGGQPEVGGDRGISSRRFKHTVSPFSVKENGELI
jgi:hypothetical protein